MTATTAAAASIAIDPTKTPDEIVEGIEAAEEAKDLDVVVAFIGLASSDEHGGDDAWSEAAEAALDALYRLVKGGATTASGNDDDSLVHRLLAVFGALRAWKEEEAIVEVGMGCLVAIASKASKDSTTEASEKNAETTSTVALVPVEFVVSLMKHFHDESTIQEQACLAIEGLALWKTGWKEALGSCEGIREELVSAKEERITNERNKKYPVRAAKALGIEIE